MPSFSQRHGYVPLTEAIQREKVTTILRTALWNVLTTHLWDKWSDYDSHNANYRINSILQRLWFSYLKRDLDALPPFSPKGYNELKKYFLTCNWFEVFDFLEFLLQDDNARLDVNAISHLNNILERENSAYRIVGQHVTENTDANELSAISTALEDPNQPVRDHINAALAMLSDRTNPDYRNSIKESISAVEAACRLVTGMKGATLGDALKKVPNLHTAQKNAFSALYGYTSDASGIRHSLMNESVLTYADAKFMLSSCSAFVSYLRSKATVQAPTS